MYIPDEDVVEHVVWSVAKVREAIDQGSMELDDLLDAAQGVIFSGSKSRGFIVIEVVSDDQSQT